MLKKYNFSSEIINEIKHCIASHRGSKNIKPQTLLAKIIANADAMAHFDILPLFFFKGWGKDKYSFEEVLDFVDNKLIQRDWNKKLTLPEAKEMVREKYKAIKLILDTIKQYR